MMKEHNFLWVLVIFLAGCMQSEEEKVKQELIQIGQCYYTGEMAHATPALRDRIDEQLMFKAASFKMTELRKAKSNVNLNFSMKVVTNIAGQEIENERLVANKINKLLKWYESDYCQGIASAFQDKLYGPADENYEKNKKNVPDPLNYRTALYLSRNHSDAASGDVGCEAYQEIYQGLVKNRVLDPYREMLSTSLMQILSRSAGELTGYRRELLEAAAKKDIGREQLLFGRGIYAEVSLSCRSTVQEALAQISYIQNALSPRTKGLMEMEEAMRREPQSCGEFPQRYCDGKLKLEAIRSVVAASTDCDRNTGVSACAAIDYSQAYEQKLIEMELERLQKFIGYLSEYIANPVKHNTNTEGSTQDQIEACKKEAIRLKYSDVDYRDYVELYCKPRAYWVFTKPQRDELDAMTRRVRQLRKQEPPQATPYGLSLDLAKLAPSSFLWACMEQDAAKLESATVTRIRAYRQAQSTCQKHLEHLQST